MLLTAFVTIVLERILLARAFAADCERVLVVIVLLRFCLVNCYNKRVQKSLFSKPKLVQCVCLLLVR